MRPPQLACCNFISDPDKLKTFALRHGFDGIDWSFNLETLPEHPGAERELFEAVSVLAPLEVRYHCACTRTDLGHIDDVKAAQAGDVLRRVCRLVSDLGGRFLTIHVGLGRNSTFKLSWDRTLKGLADLNRFARNLGVGLCLENLAWGWTSRPDLYEKLIRKADLWATLDIGHAITSPSVTSGQYSFSDFIRPHPVRFLNAHIYHEEEGDRHLPPLNEVDLEERLRLLSRLPRCDWWVLELREEAPLLQTLTLVRKFLALKFSGLAGLEPVRVWRPDSAGDKTS